MVMPSHLGAIVPDLMPTVQGRLNIGNLCSDIQLPLIGRMSPYTVKAPILSGGRFRLQVFIDDLDRVAAFTVFGHNELASRYDYNCTLRFPIEFAHDELNDYPGRQLPIYTERLPFLYEGAIPDDDAMYLYKLTTGFVLSENLIGEGSEASVFMGYSVLHGHAVAVRIPKTVAHRSEESRSSSILKMVNHPGIITMYCSSCWVRGDRECIVMDLHGKTLQEYHTSQKLDKEEKKSIMLDLLGVGSYMESKDIIYADLTTDNILISKDGCPVLTDFGAAGYLSPGHTELKHLPTQNWELTTAPPEFPARRPVDGKSFVYAAARVAFALGSPARNNREVRELQQKLSKTVNSPQWRKQQTPTWLKFAKVNNCDKDTIFLPMLRYSKDERPSISEAIELMKKY